MKPFTPSPRFWLYLLAGLGVIWLLNRFVG